MSKIKLAHGRPAPIARAQTVLTAAGCPRRQPSAFGLNGNTATTCTTRAATVATAKPSTAPALLCRAPSWCLCSAREGHVLHDFLRQKSWLVTARWATLHRATGCHHHPAVRLQAGPARVWPQRPARLQKLAPHLQHGLTLHHELLRWYAKTALHAVALDQVTSRQQELLLLMAAFPAACTSA